jgi:methyl-accepting chemotaxis protein
MPISIAFLKVNLMQKNKDRNVDAEERRNAARITPETVHAMSRASEVVSPFLERIVEDFYMWLRSRDSLRAYFQGHDHMNDTAKKQRNHWAFMFGSDFGTEYAERVQRVGEVHFRIGLEPSDYISGYAVLLEGMIESVVMRSESRRDNKRHLEHDEATIEMLRALIRGAFLDMAFSIDVYSEEKRKRDEFAAKISEQLNNRVGSALEAIVPQASQLKNVSVLLDVSAGKTLETSTQVEQESRETTAEASEVNGQLKEVQNHFSDIEQALSEVRDTTSECTESGKLASERLEHLRVSMQQVGDIVSLIDDIAERTNLLSINAMIEAARAGSTGQGFAVVAGEVKLLAGQTTEATQKIANEAKSMRGAVKEIVSTLETLIQGVQSVDDRVQSLASRIEDSVAQVSEAGAQLEQTVVRNSALAGQAESLRALAEDTRKTGTEIGTMATQMSGEMESLRTEIRDLTEKLTNQ